MTICFSVLILLQVASIATVCRADCPFSNDLFTEATNQYNLRNAYEKDLLESYGITSDQPGAPFHRENDFDPSDFQLFDKARIAIVYQDLVRDKLYLVNGSCVTGEQSCCYQDVMAQCGETIPKSDRCSGADAVTQNIDLARPKAEFSYFLPRLYEDEISMLRRSRSVTNSRSIGNEIDQLAKCLKDTSTCLPNVFAVIFGQLVTHDFSRVQASQLKGRGADGIRCCSPTHNEILPVESMSSYCVPISVPKNDPTYASMGVRCMDFKRAQTTLPSDCYLGRPLGKINMMNAFTDLEIVYFSDGLATPFRAPNGFLQMDALNVLPTNANGAYRTADGRSSQTPWLSMLHSIFYRNHNNLAHCLHATNSNWTDDKVYAVARDINIAIYMHLIYDLWIPEFLGPQDTKRAKLYTDTRQDAYNAHLDPRVMSDFTHGTFRKYHALIPGVVSICTDTYRRTASYKLSDTFGNLTFLQTDYNGFLRGMLADPMRTCVGYDNELRSFLFKTAQGIGTDLFAMDVLRGLDTGVSPYIDYYPKCFGVTINDWPQLEPYFTSTNLKILQNIYKNVHEIDLITGVVLENRYSGYLGAIEMCLLREQFYKAKYANPSFYSFKSRPNPFTKAQLDAIQRVTFASFLCSVTDRLGQVPRNALEAPDPKSNPLVSCSSFKPFDCSIFS